MLSRIALVTCLTLAAASAHAGALVDNFEEGAFSIATSAGAPGFQSAQQTGLNPMNVLSGERRANLFTQGAGDSSYSLSITGGDDAAQLMLGGDGDVASAFYPFVSTIDIGVLGNALAIDLVASEPVELTFYVSDGDDLLWTAVATGVSTGTLEVPFTALMPQDGQTDPIDLSDISELGWRVGTDAALVATFDNFKIVPEPGPALLVGLGLTALVGVRTRR